MKSKKDSSNSSGEENILISHRRRKLAKIRLRSNAFPNQFRRDSSCLKLQNKYSKFTKEKLEQDKITVKIAGRIVLNRTSFIVIQDTTERIQIYLNKKTLSDEAMSEAKTLDLGDIIGVTGDMSRSKKGDLYVNADEILLLTKSLRPLPEKHYGLINTEQRYRQRHLDLITNKDVKNLFEIRSRIIAYIRKFLIDRSFLEVETPMLQTIPGGAIARPFETYHNALDTKMFLRISPELYLKRLIIGGFERVFEINRSFRNEGVSSRHNPEFTMLEFYEAYATYEDHMNLTERLMRGLAEEILGDHNVPYGGSILNFTKPFIRLSVFDAIIQYNPEISSEDLLSRDRSRGILKKIAIETSNQESLGELQMKIFESLVETKLQQPHFITHYPIEASPLARRNDVNPNISDRFELFIGGREIANAYSELNDPEDQKERFIKQIANRKGGNDEAMYGDEEFVNALEYGMPPTAGEGIGVDRLVMILTNSPSIKDVILFPHTRSQK